MKRSDAITVVEEFERDGELFVTVEVRLSEGGEGISPPGWAFDPSRIDNFRRLVGAMLVAHGPEVRLGPKLVTAADELSECLSGDGEGTEDGNGDQETGSDSDETE